MNATHGTFFLACLMAAVCVAPAVSRAQPISTQSPFLPRVGTPINATNDNTPVELRGILAGDAGPLFGLYDPVRKQGGWLKLNEQGREFPAIIKNYDAASESVTVEYQGRMMSINLKKTVRIDAAPVVAAATPPRPLPGQPPVVQGSSPEDARRLEAVAAEVARRRQARQAAAAAAAHQQQLNQPPVAGMPNRAR